jgi:predicted secreted protein
MTLVGVSRTLAFNNGRSTIDITTKDSSDWDDFLSSRRTITISDEALYAFDDGAQAELWTAYYSDAGTVLWRVSSGVVGDTQFDGSAVVTGLNMQADDGEVATLSIELQVKGAITRVTLT